MKLMDDINEELSKPATWLDWLLVSLFLFTGGLFTATYGNSIVYKATSVKLAQEMSKSVFHGENGYYTLEINRQKLCEVE